MRTLAHLFGLLKHADCFCQGPGTAAIAQLAARGSHNPKVVSSILTGRISLSYIRNLECFAILSFECFALWF